MNLLVEKQMRTMSEWFLVEKKDPKISLFGGRINVCYQKEEKLEVYYSKIGARIGLRRFNKINEGTGRKFVIRKNVFL